MNVDYPISELRIVEVYLKGNHTPSYRHMHKDQVPTFLEATINLHYKIGNPHSGCKPGNGVALLWRISVCSLPLETKSYWWTHPSLHSKKGVGAQLNDYFGGEVVWRHPDLIKEEEEAERLED